MTIKDVIKGKFHDLKSKNTNNEATLNFLKAAMSYRGNDLEGFIENYDKGNPELEEVRKFLLKK